MLQRIHKLFFNKKGQGMTEYIIIVALIAIAAIVVIKLFGQQIRNQFAIITGSIGGQSVTDKRATTSTNAEGQTAAKGLGNYETNP